jgi:hypothetical protein
MARVDETSSEVLGPRILSLTDLKISLGAPETIVCLGNGPSSEHPQLASYRDACLFRVNWIWLDRGWMTTPDVVFTGDPDIVHLSRRPLVIFPTEVIGRPILRGYDAAGYLPVSGYAFLDSFDPPVADLTAAKIPTNGALMVALAALLRPRQLVIAGIDLYRHAAGKYPGPPDNLEGYTHRHSEAVDLQLIGDALRSFAGEALVLSENLRYALA